MRKEDYAEGKFVHNEKNGNQETCCTLLRNHEKNGILPLKSTEKKMLQLQTNEAQQQSLEARTERVSLISCEEITKTLLLFDDNAEDCDTELTPFNDLWDTSDLVYCNEYLPYYRTYANLLEIPQFINTEVKQEEKEGEGEIQSNGCVFKSIYEDEPLNNMGLDTGYVPYYRSYEDYFGNPALPSKVHSRADNEETEANITKEIESEIDHEVEEILQNSVVQGECTTDENVNQCTKELTNNNLLLDSIINSGDSEISPLDEILSLDRSSSSSYYPYYRTWGQIFFSPVASSNAECSIAVKMLW
uniref:Uncharacterized protein n=1 Tax=Sphaerodactylus townsendi TaxID=933632 RepID=A0ACB8EIS4_9SAUR